MIASLIALAIGVVSAPDPCAPVQGGEAEPALSATYRAIGEAEFAAGRSDSATAAYRSALASDTGDARSRAALAELCRDAHQERAFARGLALMRAGDHRQAIAFLEEARVAGDGAAALLEGICLYEVNDDVRAAAVLREAEVDPSNAPSARFFLGLLAIRDGRGTDAATFLGSAAAGDARLAPLASTLSAHASREGRVLFSLQAESAWDSNVALTPAGSPEPIGASDAMAGLTAGVRAAPLGESGPYAMASASLRTQLQLNAYDLRAFGGGAGWKLGRGSRYVSAEYGYDQVDLGGAPYLRAHRLSAAARLDVAPAATIGAAYLARFEAYQPAAYADDSGLRHQGEVDASVVLGRRWALTAAYRVGRDGVQDASLSWWEHGVRAALRAFVRPTVRAGLDAAASWRLYDQADPVLEVRRADAYLDAGASVEVDFAAHFTLRLAAAARRASSSIPDFTYTRLVPSVALGYTVGWL